MGELAAEAGFALETGLHGKGKIGALLERVLGATGGSAARFDFPDLEVELKTVPLGDNGRPSESTYVCKLRLLDADRAEWSASWVRKKLSRVLFVPFRALRIGRSVLFEPTPEDDAMLKSDFDEIMGLIGLGGIETLTAHTGRWLQARPKAAHGDVRTAAIGPDHEIVSATPRGFYLRASFVADVLLR